jgi:cell division protease FtsH
MGSSAIAYEVNGAWKKSALPTNNPSLQSSLLDILSDGGCTDVSALPESIWSKLGTPALAALPFVYLALLFRIMRNLHGKDDAARTYQNEESWQQTNFSHVAGLNNAVTEVSEVVSYLSNPTLYQGVGARPPRGVLLYGPSGTGKTDLFGGPRS